MHRQPHFRRARTTALLAAIVCVACWAGTRAANAVEPDAVKAIMKQQEISFYYQSFTSFYSCEGISSKVKRLLLALGAAKDIDVQARGCESSNSPSRTPLVVIQLTSPVEATPAALAELEKTRAQRELTARVRGDRGVALDAEAQFDTRYKPVSLSRGQLGLDPGDCELVDELRKKVLPKLGVRIIKDGVYCSPNQINRAQPRLEVEALMPPPPPDTSTGSSPVADSASAPAAEGSAATPESAPKP